MVWQDTNGEIYAIEGVYDGEAQHFIPIEFISSIHPEYTDGYRNITSNVAEYLTQLMIKEII